MKGQQGGGVHRRPVIGPGREVELDDVFDFHVVFVVVVVNVVVRVVSRAPQEGVARRLPRYAFRESQSSDGVVGENVCLKSRDGNFAVDERLRDLARPVRNAFHLFVLHWVGYLREWIW